MFSENELRTVIKEVWKRKSMKLRTSRIVSFRIPYLGQYKSHGNMKTKRYQRDLKKDRKKKRLKYNELLMSKNKLLW